MNTEKKLKQFVGKRKIWLKFYSVNQALQNKKYVKKKNVGTETYSLLLGKIQNLKKMLIFFNWNAFN